MTGLLDFLLPLSLLLPGFPNDKPGQIVWVNCAFKLDQVYINSWEWQAVFISPDISLGLYELIMIKIWDLPGL